MSYYTLH